MKIMLRFLVCLTLLFSSFLLKAQDIKVTAAFQADSTRVGDEIFYSLSARYPKDEQVVFPDSLFNYGGFELRSKKYFPSSTRNNQTYDSAVYVLSTFEVAGTQTLKLPVFLIKERDCTRFESNTDTIRLKLLVKSLPDSLTADLPVRATIGFQKVSKQVNVPLIFLSIVVLILIAGILWFSLGEGIMRKVRAKKMKKAHESFSTAYNTLVEQLSRSFSPETTEATIGLWKRYMEELNARPYTKLTTKETLSLEHDEKLARNLKTIDAAVYGYNNNVMDSLKNLKDFADMRFSSKVQEVLNAD
jgi:hypothetical protein